MLNPKDINPFSLPNIPLIDRKQLPSIAGIYFAIANGKVQYIGMSANLNQRWNSHHRYREISEMSDPHIAYLDVSSINNDLIGEIEEALIFWFNPPLNNSPMPSKLPRVSVYLDETLKQKVEKLANKQMRRSLSEMCAVLIAQGIEKAEKDGELED